jgi:hypothetical protein
MKHSCLKKTQKRIKISPNPSFSKRGTSNIFPPFLKRGTSNIFPPLAKGG